MFTVKKTSLNPLQTNCYFLIKENQVIIIDPSIDTDGSIDKILKKIEGLTPVCILLTHGHIDHISAVDTLVERYSLPVYIHAKDIEYLTNNQLNGATLMNQNFEFKSKVLVLPEGLFEIEGFSIKVVNTPGHTPGSVSLFYENVCFSGDCIFRLTIGRTDLSGGSTKQMKQSIMYFKSLDTDYRLYPGHGDETTLSFEKKFNPYFRENSVN